MRQLKSWARELRHGGPARRCAAMVEVMTGHSSVEPSHSRTTGQGTRSATDVSRAESIARIRHQPHDHPIIVGWSFFPVREIMDFVVSGSACRSYAASVEAHL